MRRCRAWRETSVHASRDSPTIPHHRRAAERFSTTGAVGAAICTRYVQAFECHRRSFASVGSAPAMRSADWISHCPASIDLVIPIARRIRRAACDRSSTPARWQMRRLPLSGAHEAGTGAHTQRTPIEIPTAKFLSRLQASQMCRAPRKYMFWPSLRRGACRGRLCW